MESENEFDPERGGSESPVDGSEESSARAFYSNDFAWKELQEEIEGLRAPEVGITGFDAILEAERSHGADSDSHIFFPSAWEAFHKNHSKALFFKERRYLVKEFPELVSGSQAVLEVGCGTGSSVAPVLRANSKATCYGCDCSAAALDRAKLLIADQASLHESQSNKFQPFLCDISVETIPTWLCCTACRVPSDQIHGSRDEKIAENVIKPNEVVPPSPERTCCVGGVTIVMLIFTLSAIPLERMRHVVAECAAVLQPGGYLLFRDYECCCNCMLSSFQHFQNLEGKLAGVGCKYGLYDMTMLRFPPSQKLTERLYCRKDGTLSYFFSSEVVRQLFTSVGLVEEELHYCCVQLVNRRKQVPMKRVWVHAKFRKPVVTESPCEF